MKTFAVFKNSKLQSARSASHSSLSLSLSTQSSHGEMQQNPAHCENPSNAPVVEEEGHVSGRQPPPAAGRAGRTRGDLRGD